MMIDYGMQLALPVGGGNPASRVADAISKNPIMTADSTMHQNDNIFDQETLAPEHYPSAGVVYQSPGDIMPSQEFAALVEQPLGDLMEKTVCLDDSQVAGSPTNAAVSDIYGLVSSPQVWRLRQHRETSPYLRSPFPYGPSSPVASDQVLAVDKRAQENKHVILALQDQVHTPPRRIAEAKEQLTGERPSQNKRIPEGTSTASGSIDKDKVLEGEVEDKKDMDACLLDALDSTHVMGEGDGKSLSEEVEEVEDDDNDEEDDESQHDDADPEALISEANLDEEQPDDIPTKATKKDKKEKTNKKDKKDKKDRKEKKIRKNTNPKRTRMMQRQQRLQKRLRTNRRRNRVRMAGRWGVRGGQ